jgi:hypothetical protein
MLLQTAACIVRLPAPQTGSIGRGTQLIHFVHEPLLLSIRSNAMTKKFKNGRPSDSRRVRVRGRNQVTSRVDYLQPETRLPNRFRKVMNPGEEIVRKIVILDRGYPADCPLVANLGTYRFRYHTSFNRQAEPRRSNWSSRNVRLWADYLGCIEASGTNGCSRLMSAHEAGRGGSSVAPTGPSRRERLPVDRKSRCSVPRSSTRPSLIANSRDTSIRLTKVQGCCSNVQFPLLELEGEVV